MKELKGQSLSSVRDSLPLAVKEGIYWELGQMERRINQITTIRLALWGMNGGLRTGFLRFPG